MTRQEIDEKLTEQRSIINEMTKRLSSKDYIGIKIAEGKATKSEYSEEIALTDKWREELNAAQQEEKRLLTLTPDEPEIPDASEEFGVD